MNQTQQDRLSQLEYVKKIRSSLPRYTTFVERWFILNFTVVLKKTEQNTLPPITTIDPKTNLYQLEMSVKSNEDCSKNLKPLLTK